MKTKGKYAKYWTGLVALVLLIFACHTDTWKGFARFQLGMLRFIPAAMIATSTERNDQRFAV